MTDEQAITLIEREFLDKTFGVTEQYLEIHAPIYNNNKLQIGRIDRDRDKLIIAYLPVQDERFYFAVYIDDDLGKIISIDTEPDHQVYFFATSENLSATELKAMCSLSVDESWNKGDLKKNGRSTHKISALKIIPNSEPDEFEDKLNKLLTYLETDKKGISQLVEKADGYIQVSMDIHNGNGMIGGPNISKESITRMHNLKLSMDFSLYVSGNSFR